MSGNPSPQLTRRQFDFVGAAVFAATLAHAPHLPFVVTLVVDAILALAMWRKHRNLPALAGPVKLALIAIFVLSLLIEYRNPFGREPGSALACAMLALKLLETRARRDALAAICFASFTLMSALLFDTSLVFTLTAFLGAILLLAALREIELPAITLPMQTNSLMATYGPSLRLGAMSLALAAPLALCGFLFIPRMQSPLWRTPDGADGRSGLSDTMSPGSVQRLLLDDSAAFRVGFDGALPPRSQLYWRGPVLTDFDGATWRRHESNLPANALDSFATGDTVDYEITLEASDKPWLFALDLPIQTSADTRRDRDMSLTRRQSTTAPLRYRVRSALRYRLDANLSPQQRETALALPSDFNPRSQRLGTQWRHDLHDDDAIVQAALDLFHASFYYTLSPPPLGRDSVDDFLFDTKRGFCEHYAAAFVVLMRAAGIPARVVTGYQGGYFNRVGNYLLVRQSDAHAWAEVWLAARGWTRVDPTAAVSPARVQLGAQAVASGERAWYRADWLLALRNQADLIDRGWNNLVVQFNTQRQQALLGPLGIERIDATTLIWLLIGTGCVLLAGATLWTMRAARQRALPIDIAYDALCRKLARIVAPRGVNEGPCDYAARVQASGALGAARAIEVRALFERYVSLRYARALASPAEIQSFVRSVQRLRFATRN
ncbi:MAG: DUF3488 domain-containing transglutaminase family protein [Proteobacteria bacterium]|nr:DUF3488 domain-containing transglutaminase family protein [Pseudomonadota bacterium]